MPVSSPLPAPPPIAAMVFVVAALAWIAPGGAPFESRLACDLALLAGVVAAREGRVVAALCAAGIACGIAPYGAMMIPLAFGVGIVRRGDPGWLALIPVAALATLATGFPVIGWASGWTSAAGLWAVLPRPAGLGLLVAGAIGSLAYLTATLPAKLRSDGARASAALTCALVGILVLPAMSPAVPLALAMDCADRRVRMLTGLAAALAVLEQPVAATLATAGALWLVARPLMTPVANDNWAPRPLAR